jgi:4-diphosphocytidyl-2-C-methyl-D-erythritol kinase
MHVTAPTKINLSLRVLGRRADGFHELETLMAPLTLADELTVEKAGAGIAFTCSDTTLPTGDDNLAVRAARAFFDASQLDAGLMIHLEKRIPHGAGLGGGSSDAASTLLALDELFETKLGTTRLAEIAASLGSDVPFFIHRSAAVCRGRGEIVEPCVLPQKLPLLLVKPPFGVPTPWAYSKWADSLEIDSISYAPQQFGGVEFVNDLERPVFEKYLFLALLKRWLLAQPETGAALMSGSGSTMLAVLRDEGAGEALRARVIAEFGDSLWTCLCATA